MRLTRSASKRAKAAEGPSTTSATATSPDDTNHTDAVLAKFTVFPKLPLEIRQMIWNLSLDSRIVEICLNDASGFYSRAKLPYALQVSKESRDTVVGQYSLCFGSAWYPARTRFNFDLDTLYFDRGLVSGTRLFFGSLRDFELASLRNVAIDMYIGSLAEFYMIAYDVMDGICKSLQAMPKLTTLLAVYETQHFMEGVIMDLDMQEDLTWMESSGDTSKIQFYNNVPDEVDAYLRRNQKGYFGFDNMIPEWPFYGDYDDFKFFDVYGLRQETKERVIQKNMTETSGATKVSRRGRSGRQKRV